MKKNIVWQEVKEIPPNVKPEDKLLIPSHKFIRIKKEEGVL